MLNKFCAFLFLLFCCISCTNEQKQSTHPCKLNQLNLKIDNILSNMDTALIIDFRLIGQFDSLIIYGPYTTKSQLESTLGCTINNEQIGDFVDDSHCLFVLKGKDLNNNFFFLDRKIDFAEESGNIVEYDNSIFFCPDNPTSKCYPKPSPVERKVSK